MKLYIMRHGQANVVAQSDKERTLCETGRFQSMQMAKWLALSVEQFSITFCSPYVRAEQTYEIVSKEFKPPAQSLVLPELTPDADPVLAADSILAYAAQVKAESALVVSHLPLVGLLVSELCPGEVASDFATASIACLDIDLESWQGKLEWQQHYSKLY